MSTYTIYKVNQLVIVLVFCVAVIVGSELSTYARQNCLLTPVLGAYDCDITNNPLLFKLSTLPGEYDIVYIAEASGLNFSIGKTVTFAGLEINATDTYISVKSDAYLNIGGSLVLGENTTLDVGGTINVFAGSDLLKNAQLKIWGQSSFGAGLNSQADSQITVYPEGVLQLNGSSNLFGGLQLYPNSALMIYGGVVHVVEELVSNGDISVSSGSLVLLEQYTQFAGTLQLCNGTISAPTVIVALNGTIAGGEGGVMGDLVLNGTFELTINSDTSFTTVVVENTTYIGGDLVVNNNTLPHTHTYTFLTSSKSVGKFRETHGTWFSNATTYVVYEEVNKQDSVVLAVSEAAPFPRYCVVLVVLFVFLSVNI